MYDFENKTRLPYTMYKFYNITKTKRILIGYITFNVGVYMTVNLEFLFLDCSYNFQR